MKGYEKYVDLMLGDVEIGSVLFDEVKVMKYTKQYVFSYKGNDLCKLKNKVVRHNLKFNFTGNDVKCIYYYLDLTK